MMRRFRLLGNPDLTLAGLLDDLLAAAGDRLVSLELDETGAKTGQSRLSDLRSEVACMSRFLAEEAGLRRGDRVAIWKTNDPRSFRWFLAAIRAGGIAVPLNPLLSPAEVRAILTRSEASVLVTDARLFQSAAGSPERLPAGRFVQAADEPPLAGFLRFSPGGPELAPVSRDPSDPVAVFFSSGTEGAPKGAALSSQALLAGRAMARYSASLVCGRGMALFALPWAHIMAVSVALYGLLAGVPACLLPRFEAAAAIGAIERYRVSIVTGVPSMFIRLVNAAPSRESLSSVRLWVSASDFLPGAYRKRLLEYGALAGGRGRFRLGPVLINAYGMVELGGLAMLGIAAPFLPGEGEWCFPLPPFRVRVADEEGRVAPPDVTAECQVAGPGVTGCYWGDRAGGAGPLTADGWLRTGDLAVRNRLGMVRITGRAKDVIKCGGYSVFAQEVEEALSSHPAVSFCAVVGVSHREKGETPVAIVERRPGFAVNEDELREWARLRLAAYKTPRRVHVVEQGALPRGATGKVLKRVLRQQYAADSNGPDGRPL
ncbi:MAG: acyl--CoA ligase [Bryobacterales bacterium]|nr:acyl--CoA ligase [Bryobacterales bacterium]